MARSIALILPLLLFAACELDSVADRVEVSTAEPELRIDLDPSTASEGVDNTLDVTVSFAPREDGGQSGNSVVFSLYRVDFLSEDAGEAPYLAGEIAVELDEGASATLTLPVVARAQLDWAAGRTLDGALPVRGRVHLAGVYDDKEAILATGEFEATFADYD